MALAHASAGEALDVRPLGPALPGARTTALFKSRDLELIRLVLAAGKSLPPHKVPGEITIQCLEGRLRIDLDGGSGILEAGELMFLAGGETHAVAALSDASALVTVVLC